MENKEKKIHVDVNLTDGYGNPTEVSLFILKHINIKNYDMPKLKVK